VHKKIGSLFLALHRSDGGSLPQATPSSPSYMQSAMKHYDAAMMLGAYDRDVRAFYASHAVKHDSSVGEESPVAPTVAADAVEGTSGAGRTHPATDPAPPTTYSIRTSRWVMKPSLDPPLSEDISRHMGGSMDMKMGGSMESLLRSVEESIQPQTASTAFEQMVRQQEALQQE